MTDFDDVVRRRRMTRRFDPAPVPPAVRDRILAAALTAPSAGHSQGVDLLVLESEATREAFFAATTDAEWRSGGAAAQGILAAPLLVLPLADPDAYVRRYARPDKVGSGLAGVRADEWPVPYWLVDAAFATMILLLSAGRHGLGALFFRLHRDVAPFCTGAGVPPGRVAIGAVALGWPRKDGETRRRPRPRRPDAARIHLDRWNSDLKQL